MNRLAGWRVLLPRPSSRSSRLIGLLGAEGATAQAIPLLAFEPPADTGALDAAVVDLARGGVDWVAFTSVNAVDAVLDRASALALHPAVPADTRVAVVGPATARAVRAAGIAVDLMPESGGSAATLAAIWPAPGEHPRVLLPQSAIASDTLAVALRARGFQVQGVPAYRTVPLPPPSSIAEDLADGAFEAVLLTSPSTVAALAGLPVAAGTVIGAIGASTAAAVREAGLALTFTAADPTEQGLVDALAAVAAATPAATPAPEEGTS
ncbi:hypothetical protein GIS00_04210 [Nakamurella sp. YIM 132087]|uniref:Tetrapyrrole biosynthesis uroporphyrinogen III synthase domain-containing protein n=1 Tax=Nakamurella alba TaxID=2665158 RepID=A0A7K1FI83_9ACTN|nr:uroporphyrinogen-III synthase [Nakamurella alba]MTD13149.1 hypothetical protein [Nakamurella alba]